VPRIRIGAEQLYSPVHIFMTLTALSLLLLYSKNRNSQNSSLCGFLLSQFTSSPSSKCRHGHIILKNSCIYIFTLQLQKKNIFFYVKDLLKKLLEINQDLTHTLCWQK